MNSSRRPSATKPTFLYMLLVCREKLNLQRGRIIQWDSSSKHTDRLLLFSEIHSSPFSAGAFFLTKEKSNCVFPTDKKWIWVSMQWEICRNFDKISFWWGGEKASKRLCWTISGTMVTAAQKRLPVLPLFGYSMKFQFSSNVTCWGGFRYHKSNLQITWITFKVIS